MGDHQLTDLVSEIIGIYREIDQKTGLFQMASGLRCPDQCGTCCENQNVESTVLECLPLASGLYRLGEEETVSAEVDEKLNRGDMRCVLFRPDERFPGNGRCFFYEVRPLVCRLFGFASRRNKFGDLELCPCKVMRERTPGISVNGAGETPKGVGAPVYQDSFMRLASLHPGLGYRRLPINTAIKEALAYFYFRKPKKFAFRKAA